MQVAAASTPFRGIALGSKCRVIEFFWNKIVGAIAYKPPSGGQGLFMDPAVCGISFRGEDEQGAEMTETAPGNTQLPGGTTDHPVQTNPQISAPLGTQWSLSQAQLGSAATALTSLLLGCGGAADDEVDPSLLQTDRAKDQPQWLRSAATRSTTAPGLSRIPTADQLFVWAQTGFADFFPGNPTTESIPGVVFRRYRSGHLL